MCRPRPAFRCLAFSKRADPALVDPGVTAQLECLLDDVVVGKQEMVGAIDAVCDVAQRIIGKLTENSTTGGLLLPCASDGNGAAAYPPTPAMKRFADSLSRQKSIKPPSGYKTSISICPTFSANTRTRTPIIRQVQDSTLSQCIRHLLHAKKIAQGKGLIIPDEAKTNSATMSAWIDLNRAKTRRKSVSKTTYQPKRSAKPQSTAPVKRTRKRKANTDAASLAPASTNSATGTRSQDKTSTPPKSNRS